MNTTLPTLRMGLMVVAVVIATSGCNSWVNDSAVEAHWGEAYDAHISLQEADPSAPATTEPLEDLDPETGARVAERYYQGQERQRQREAPAVLIQGR